MNILKIFLKPFRFILKIPIIFFRRFLYLCNNYFDNYRNFAISLLPNNGGVTLVDIGAAGEVEPRWKPFISKINYIGFEPDERSRHTLLNKKSDFQSYKIYPYALSHSDESITLNLCRKPQTSSLYQPNKNFLKLFPDAERFDVVSNESIDCVRLDSLQLDDIDFVKIDIQGAENDVLKGGAKSLDAVLGLEIEVEFIDLYLKQPLFGDVCNTLSELGFEFMDYTNLCRWERDDHNSFGQCVFGDALFLKTPEFLDINTLGVSKISAYFSILLIYRRFDLIQTSLNMLSQDLRKNFYYFEKKFQKVKKRNLIARKLTQFINKLIHSLGSSYRIFLIE